MQHCAGILAQKEILLTILDSIDRSAIEMATVMHYNNIKVEYIRVYYKD